MINCRIGGGKITAFKIVVKLLCSVRATFDYRQASTSLGLGEHDFSSDEVNRNSSEMEIGQLQMLLLDIRARILTMR